MAGRVGTGRRLIGFVAQYPHLRRHLQPVIDELVNRGCEVREGSGDLTLTAARYDAQRVAGPVVLVEHGAGQTYQIDGAVVDAGSSNKSLQPLGNVVLYVGPNQALCDLYRAWLPTAKMVVASPIIEWMRAQSRAPEKVAFAVHWASPLASSVPEAGTSWPESADILKALKPDIAHCHPRIAGRFLRDLNHRQIDTPYVADWDQIWPQLRLLVVDNSSILWEAAAVGIDVAVINPRGWAGRHGLRFGFEGDSLVRVDESNAVEVKTMALPGPLGSPYEKVEGATGLVADAVQSVNVTQR